jgi:hypothetical protein
MNTTVKIIILSIAIAFASAAPAFAIAGGPV